MAGRIAERAQHGGDDDGVSRLRELFPEVDPDVCGVILHENSGDIERAVNQLLQLTDPSYRPDDDQPPPGSSPGADRSSEAAAQVLQDEEYAVRLQQEEETELRRAAEGRQASNAHQEQPDVPLVDQLSAFADSAKSKITSFVDRLKAKPAGDNNSRPASSSDARSPLYTTLPEDDDALFVVGTPEPPGSSRAGEADEDDAPLERRQHARNQHQQQL